MRALTIRQPWAWAWLHGKPVENRSWYMSHRGELALHAGARSRWDPDGEASPLVQRAWARQAAAVGGPVNWPGPLTRNSPSVVFGAVTAVVQVTGCHHWSEDTGEGCDPWAAVGQYHIEFADVLPLVTPVPCRGWLGLWRLPADVEAAVREQTGQLPAAESLL